MNTGWFVLALIGTTGWIFLFKEILKKWNLSPLKHTNTDNFQTTLLSHQLGKLQFLKITWKDHEYFIATDIQTGNITVIDKTPTSKVSHA